MTTDCRETPHLDLQETTIGMAVMAVVMERIRSLPMEDKGDLFELSKALVAATTQEEYEAAASGMREILQQADGMIVPLKTPEELTGAMESWAQRVGPRIKQAREEVGLTQTELEKRTGLPQSHISRLESQVHVPSFATLEKIARAMDKPVSYFDPLATDGTTAVQ